MDGTMARVRGEQFEHRSATRKVEVYLKSVSLQAFKSFGSPSQSFVFKKGLNLIAGPNGSGKSNILDGIRFALCEKPTGLRARTASELQSTLCKEPCEVKVEIASSICTPDKSSARGWSNDLYHGSAQADAEAISVLTATLLPDNSRAYKIDGRPRTMKDVKEFLRSKRLLAESSVSVLQQSQITALADCNSPAVLAGVIASASGAGLWNEEVKRAVELKRTEKRLEEINGNILVLEKSIATDRLRFTAIERLREVDMEISAFACSLHQYLSRRAGESERHILELQDSARHSEEQLRDTDAKKKDCKTALKKMQEECRCPQSSRAMADEKSRLLQQIAKLEEEEQSFKNQIARQAECLKKMEGLQFSVEQASVNLQMLKHRLEEQQRVVDGLDIASKKESSSFKMQGSGPGVCDSHNSLSGLILAVSAAIAQAERDLESSENERGRVFTSLKTAMEARENASRAVSCIDASLRKNLQRLHLARKELDALSAPTDPPTHSTNAGAVTGGGGVGNRTPNHSILTPILPGDAKSQNRNFNVCGSPDSLSGYGRLLLNGRQPKTQTQALVERARSVLEKLQSESGKLEDVKNDLQTKIGVLDCRLGSLTAEEEAVPAWSFHSRFHFKDCSSSDTPGNEKRSEISDLSKYIEALNAILGSSLKSICVTETTDAAAKLLEIWERREKLGSSTSERKLHGGKADPGPVHPHDMGSVFSRIWPLDRLCYVDKERQHREVQQKFGKGDVIVPLDMFEFDPKFVKAMKKAFTSYVIATTDDVAAKLIAQHNVPNATISGKINCRGSIVGGWRGGAQNAMCTSFVGVKYHRDQMNHQLSCVCDKLLRASKILERVQRVVAEVEEAAAEEKLLLTEMKERTEEVQSLSTEVRRQQLRLETCENTMKQLVETIRCKNDDKDAYRKLAKSTSESERGAANDQTDLAGPLSQSSSLSLSSSSKVRSRLGALLSDAKEKETRLQTEIEALIWEIEKGKDEERQLCAEEQLLRSADISAQLHHCSEQLADAQRQLAEWEKTVDDRSREDKENLDRINHETKQLKRLESEASNLAIVIERLSASLKTEEKVKLCLQKEYEELRGLESQLERNATLSSEGVQLTGVDICDERQYNSVKRKLRQLIKERSQQSDQERQVSIEEQAGFRDQVEKLEMYKERASSFMKSIEKLNDSIEKIRSGVVKVNELTFHAIRRSFVQSCRKLLPNKVVDIVQVGSEVEGGLKFVLANTKPMPADTADGWTPAAVAVRETYVENAEGGPSTRSGVEEDAKGLSTGVVWTSGLGELSGGQRTMISLAFVLTVARHMGSAVVLMDEADAALDEQNQQLMAGLIKEMAVEGTQVICISHNVAFQRFSDHVVHVSKPRS